MTDVIEEVRRANPVSSEILANLDSEELRRLVSERLRDEDAIILARTDTTTANSARKRRWLAAVASFAGVLAMLGLAFGLSRLNPPDVDQPAVVVAPNPDDRMVERTGVQAARELFAAIDSGDLEGVLARLEPSLLENPKYENAFEFLIALRASWRLDACNASRPAEDVIYVWCTLTIDGPLFRATGTDVGAGSISVDAEGRLRKRPNSLVRPPVDKTFVEYASQVDPEAFDTACSPSSYDPPGYRSPPDAQWHPLVEVIAGHAWAGECGDLWARLAPDAAAWVEAGKPQLEGD